MKRLRAAAVVIVLGVPCAAALAQGVPAARPNLAGVWTLDWYLSDNPQQVAEALRIDTGQRGDQVFGPERARGGSGRGNAAGARASQLGGDDQKRLEELTAAVQFPPTTLTISQTDADITIGAPSGTARTLRTDGKRERYQLKTGAVDRTATWEGPQLIVTYEVSRAGQLTYTYRVVPTTRQLLIKVNFVRDGMPGPIEIKVVYGLAPSR
jgi:hypothetical protein